MQQFHDKLMSGWIGVKPITLSFLVFIPVG